MRKEGQSVLQERRHPEEGAQALHHVPAVPRHQLPPLGKRHSPRPETVQRPPGLRVQLQDCRQFHFTYPIDVSPLNSCSQYFQCRFRAGPIAHLASEGGKRTRKRLGGSQHSQRLPHGLRGDPVVPGAGDPPGEEELHEGGRHVESGLHPRRDDRRQAALPGQKHHGPGTITCGRF